MTKSKTKTKAAKPDTTNQPNLPSIPNQPRFLVKDKASGVTVDIDANDPGTRERNGKGDVFDKSVSQDRVGDVAIGEAEVNKRLQRVFRSQDSLDIMVRNKTISQTEYAAGKRFKQLWDVANASHYSTIDFNRSGGSVSPEDFKTAQINASRRLDEIWEHVGGRSSVTGMALEHIIVRGVSFYRMFESTGRPVHYWRGSLHSGLTSLVGYFDKSKRKQKDN